MNIFNRKKKQTEKPSWFLCQFKSGQYADGYYGTSCGLDDDEQIFRHDQLPYIPGNSCHYIFVGEGPRPSIGDVRNLLYPKEH
jgi:hypothetical protein